MRDKYEEQLLTLNTELMRMGALCEEAISCAVRSLTENDGTMKQRVSETEKQIDHKERDIESLYETSHTPAACSHRFQNDNLRP